MLLQLTTAHLTSLHHSEVLFPEDAMSRTFQLYMLQTSPSSRASLLLTLSTSVHLFTLYIAWHSQNLSYWTEDTVKVHSRSMRSDTRAQQNLKMLLFSVSISQQPPVQVLVFSSCPQSLP